MRLEPCAFINMVFASVKLLEYDIPSIQEINIGSASIASHQTPLKPAAITIAIKR